jgi:hypothetical protein
VWGVVKEYTQDQINAVSLLARLELAGVDVGDRWQDVATTWPCAWPTMCCPFWTCNTCTAWPAPAGTEAARALLRNIDHHAATRTEAHERTVWQQVNDLLPAAHGLLAHAQGDWAVRQPWRLKLGVALPRLVEIGGSHAQRDLFGRREPPRHSMAAALLTHAELLRRPWAASSPWKRRCTRGD